MHSDLVSLGETQVFILGSYETREKERLMFLRDQINAQSGGRAYLMDEFSDNLHPIVQFRIIADFSDVIVGICEHDQGGFQVELGILLAVAGYLDRTHLLKRTYRDEEDEHTAFNWMLDSGVFDLFEFEGGLREWETRHQLEDEIEDLLEEIL